jgi:hypothetical protein
MRRLSVSISVVRVEGEEGERKHMAKTVSASKFAEWKGLDKISPTVHEMKCIWRETSKDDYGIDGEIQIVVPKTDGEGYETTDGYIKVQSKSGASYITHDTDISFSTAVSRNDLDSWYGSTYPVVFIVYHPGEDKLFWKEVKTYIKSTPNVFQPPYKMVFDKAQDVFDSSCYDRIRDIGGASPPRVSFHQKERLYSNLLLVKRGPRTIFYAPTEYKTDRQIRDLLQSYVPPFCVQDGTLFTLADLRDGRCKLRAFCDVAGIDDDLADQWAVDNEKNYVYLLNQLLGSHLWRCGLRYNRDYKRNYFPKEEDSDDPIKRDWHNIRTARAARPRTVTKYYKYGLDHFWRHLALNVQFKKIGLSWFLQINPKYFFTCDGTQPYDNERVGSLTTKIKAREFNNHVLNHILFWADMLSQHQPVIHLKLFSRKIMVIEKEPMSGVANFAIPNDPAVYEADDTPQIDFSAMLLSSEDEDEDQNDEEDDEDEY